jgi:hypothetical protein
MADIDIINDFFWLKFAKDHVTNAISSRDDAAKNLDIYLKFIWPIYTGFFALGTAFSAIPGTVLIKIFMSLPIIIIPWASFQCIQVQLPAFVQFHPSEPESIINDLYKKTIAQKTRDLKAARIWVIIAALSISLSIFLYRISDIHSSDYSIRATAFPLCKQLKIEGCLPENQDLSISVIGLDSSGKPVLCSETQKINSGLTGKVNLVLNNCGIYKDPQVFCTWIDKNKKKQALSSD